MRYVGVKVYVKRGEKIIVTPLVVLISVNVTVVEIHRDFFLFHPDFNAIVQQMGISIIGSVDRSCKRIIEVISGAVAVLCCNQQGIKNKKKEKQKTQDHFIHLA
jgi:hypothetical protein